MRIPWSSVDRSITLENLKKDLNWVELKRKGPPDAYGVKYRVSSCAMRLWKKYYSNNFKFKKTPTPKQKNPTQPQNVQPDPLILSGFRGLKSTYYTVCQLLTPKFQGEVIMADKKNKCINNPMRGSTSI